MNHATYEDGYNNALDSAEVAIEKLYMDNRRNAVNMDDIRSVLRALMDSEDK
jgi:hypothetical protein